MVTSPKKDYTCAPGHCDGLRNMLVSFGIALPIIHLVAGTVILRFHDSMIFSYWLKAGAVYAILVAVGGKRLRKDANQVLLSIAAVGIALVHAPFWISPFMYVSSLGIIVYFVSVLLLVRRRSNPISE